MQFISFLLKLLYRQYVAGKGFAEVLNLFNFICANVNVIALLYINDEFNNVILSEAIQSRCAVLRYSRLTDAQVLHRLLEVCEKEQVCSDFLNSFLTFENRFFFVI